MSDLDRYRRHARRYGPDGILEAGAATLDIRDLATLKYDLLSAYPRWTPPASVTVWPAP